MSDDDLSSFSDDPILRALTGPASAEELSGEADAMTAFRAANPRRLQLVRRLGTGGAALGIAALATTGVAAAAYNSALPAPIQRVAHTAFHWLGVPPTHSHHRPPAASGPKSLTKSHPPVAESTTSPASPTATSLPPTPSPAHSQPSPTPAVRATVVSASSTAPASTSPPASTKPTHHAVADGRHPTSKASPSATSPSASTSPSPSASASSSPTPSPTVTTPTPGPTKTKQLPPTTISAEVSRPRVVYDGATTVVATLLDASGAPVRHRRVALVEHDPGAGAHVVTILRSGPKGRVRYQASGLTHNIKLVLRTHKVRSDPQRVIVRPIVSATVTSASDSAEATINVATEGGDEGDRLIAIRRVHGHKRVVAEAMLDDTGSATLTVPEVKRAVIYRVVVRKSPQHGPGGTKITIPAAGDAAPSPAAG